MSIEFISEKIIKYLNLHVEQIEKISKQIETKFNGQATNEIKQLEELKNSFNKSIQEIKNQSGIHIGI